MAIELSEKQIKDGWQIVKFGEIAKEVKSTTKDPAEDGLEFYVGLDHLDPQSLRIARKGIIAEDNPSFTRRFSAGQILFGKRRCYQKKAAVADFEGICSGDIIVMDAIPKKIIPGLLPFIIQSDAFFDWAEKTSSGSLSPRTKWKSLAEFEFPLPPIERQKEILEVLEKLEECEKKCIKQSLAGEILFRSASKNILKIVPQYSKTDSSLPSGWQVKKLCEIAKVERGKFTPRPRNNPIYYGGQYPFVQTGDVKNSGGLITSHSQTLNDKGLAVSKIFPKGSILITIAANIGEVGLTTYETACTDSVVAIQPQENIDQRWLLFYMMQLKGHLNSVATESAQKNINLATLKPLKIAVPNGKTQSKLSSILDMCFRANQETSKKLDNFRAIRRSLLGNIGGVQ